jgi:CBS domain-containing protein
VLTLMRSRGIRRVPVTLDNGVLTGIVTLDDLLKVMAAELRCFVDAIESEQKHEKKLRV